MMHRPIYCFTPFELECNLNTMDNLILGQGIRWRNDLFSRRIFGLENLLHTYGTDLLLAGHEHYYVRTKPVFRHNSNSVQNETDSSPYHDPMATVHLITGSGVYSLIFNLIAIF